MSEPTARVLSGIQPTGDVHLGNYFGAIQNHLALQDRYPGECYYFVADYHALTTVHDAKALRQSVRDIAITYLALGLDPARACLFRQSDVPEVTELTWLLACATGRGLLERAHAYKDKAAHGLPASMGLFCYPILMAADILAYDASLVPVGQDQLQHVEMAQDMATHFNETFGAGAVVLRRPEPLMSKAPRVVGLDGEKMSKSYQNTIGLFLEGKALRKLTSRIVTDSTPLGQPLPTEGDRVLALLDLFLDERGREQVRGWYRTGARDGQPFGYGHAKALLAEHIETHFADARARRQHLIDHPEEVDRVLAEGGRTARARAIDTIERCRSTCGLR